jgi:TolA-binding protein
MNMPSFFPRPWLAVVLLAALPLAAYAVSPEELVSAAESAEKAGALTQAADLYKQFLAENKEHIQRSLVLYRLSLVQENQGLSEDSMASLKQSVAIPADKNGEKHRPDAYMRLAKLQAHNNRYAEAADTLQLLFKEGAALYEDEAQNLRAGYLTLMGKYDEAAILFNILRNKANSIYAKEAAYKMAIVWLKAGNAEMAKNAIEEFAQRYPTHPKVVELFVSMARSYFEKKDYKNAAELSRQVIADYKETPEAMEAALIVALCYREANKLELAVDRLEDVSRMPQAARNAEMVSESLFEAAQICRKSLTNKMERAIDLYTRAASVARINPSERQVLILEQSLYYAAEYFYQREQWSSAYDLYAQLRAMKSRLNLTSRIMQCKAKMSADGKAGLEVDNEDDLAHIRKQIADNPGALIALQYELLLLDKKVQKTFASVSDRQGIGWGAVQILIDEYNELLKKYPGDVLNQEEMRPVLRLRMGNLYAYAQPSDPARTSKLKTGIELIEQSLQEAPQALFRVEALQSLAFLYANSAENKKAFETQKKLLELTGQDPTSSQRTAPELLRQMMPLIRSDDLTDDAIATMQQVVAKGPENGPEVRQARFNLAELAFMKKRYQESIKLYKEFIKRYGPPQDPDGRVSALWKKPAGVDEVLDQVYECGYRVVQCWRASTQPYGSNALAACTWMIENQNYLNPRIPEVLYYVIDRGENPAKLPNDKKDELARAFWTRMVNPSLDFGSKAFKAGFYGWMHDGRAAPFVRVALMKAAQLSAEINKHQRAAEMYQSFVEIYAPENPKLRNADGFPLFPRDDMYYMASYALGRELVLDKNFVSMVKAFNIYVDDMRESKFRAAALQLMGHYGTQAELFNEAAEAYAALLDEYSPAVTNTAATVTNIASRVYLKPEQRLRKNSKWDGYRMPLPDKIDIGDVRYGLGLLYWKKEQWPLCITALQPFLIDPILARSPSRAEALFMLGRCQMKTGLFTAGQLTMERSLKDHPDYKAAEEIYLDLIRSHVDTANWPAVTRTYQDYLVRNKEGRYRSHMDLYQAVSQLNGTNEATGERTLIDLSKAETFEDVKAEAYYRLAVRKLGEKTPPDQEGALPLLRKSIAAYPLAPALMEAARCAKGTKNFAAAREFLDQLVRQFPKADQTLIDQVQQLRRQIQIAEMEARR